MTADHLGSPRVVTNENGIVTSRKDFTAFGEENYTAQQTEALGYEPDTIRKGYTGYEKDDESGLDFAQARYYNAGHGRYTSVDPLTASGSIKNPQTFNRYSYVLNSPYKFTDPLGLLPLTSAGACGNFCPNSGPTIDGSAFRGRDASFDWAEFSDVGIAAGHEASHAQRQQTTASKLPYCSQGHMCFGEQAEASREADAIVEGDVVYESSNGLSYTINPLIIPPAVPALVRELSVAEILHHFERV